MIHVSIPLPSAAHATHSAPCAPSQEVDAGDYSTVRVLEGKVVVVLDPWYDQDLNPNRAKEKRYAFDVVFDESINQMEVYTQTARGLVDGVLDGYNSSVFAYGATGAGKTHTMLGSLDQPGVMVNTLHDMFTRMKEANFSDAKFKVRDAAPRMALAALKLLGMPSMASSACHIPTPLPLSSRVLHS